jgi:hypothetical protein
MPATGFASDSARARAGDGYFTWLDHIWHAAACTRPIRLDGHLKHIDPDTGELLYTVATDNLPDQVIYKPAATAAPPPAPMCPRRATCLAAPQVSWPDGG